MFTPHPTPLPVGKWLVYAPQGATPYAPAPVTPDTILPAWDTVSVLSTWTRDYLPDGGETLVYVRSHTTGVATHVGILDLKPRGFLDTYASVNPGEECDRDGVWSFGVHLEEVPRSQTAPLNYCMKCLGLGVPPRRVMPARVGYSHAAALVNGR